MERWAHEQEPKEALTWPTSRPIRKLSRRSARSSPSIKVPGAENAEADQTWSDLDVDSLDLVEVVKALEDRYDVQIADGRLKSIATVGDAAALVQELTREKAGASA